MTGRRHPVPQGADPELAGRLLSSLDDAVALLRESSLAETPTEVRAARGETLLDQCVDLCSQPTSLPIEPVRTVHHFACTGGSVLSKCIGAMPNVQLLSEIDPLSPMFATPDAHRFAPTDMVTLLRQSTRGVDDDAVIELFHAQMNLLRERTARLGQRLVLRDHAHSRFCWGPQVDSRPTLRELLAVRYRVRSIVTVRHPAESYSSLLLNNWQSFSPKGIDEYCRRYVEFLDRHAAIPIFRYEDFVEQPTAAMSEICDALDLFYADHFVDVFDAITVTGDSGRSGGRISWRPPREQAVAVAEAARLASANYRILCGRLDYSNELLNKSS